jgi:succinyl-CoA synthetase beta subunit
MLTDEMIAILDRARDAGWVVEPEAKRLLALADIDVPRFAWVHSEDQAIQACEQLGFPLAAKVVSPEVLHKSDAGGVAVDIHDAAELAAVYNRMRSLPGFDGLLIEPMVSGIEMIIGGKVDYQFGPIVLFGIGGTSVEIYQDTAVRMAPLTENDVRSMVAGLKGGKLLQGYRGSRPANMDRLAKLLIRFSNLLAAMEERVESIDLNPVICTEKDCIVADARILLAATEPSGITTNG